MAKVKKTQFAILGLLTIKSMSGYDIKKYTESHIGYFWAENYGAIYPTLNQLYEKGLVTSEEKNHDSKRHRKIYTITEKGLNRLLCWLKEKVETEKIRDELSFKLFFGTLLSIDENIERIEEEKKQKEVLLNTLNHMESMIKQAKKLRPDKKQELNYQLMTVLRGRYEIDADIKWCDTCLMMLKDMK